MVRGVSKPLLLESNAEEGDVIGLLAVFRELLQFLEKQFVKPVWLDAQFLLDKLKEALVPVRFLRLIEPLRESICVKVQGEVGQVATGSGFQKRQHFKSTDDRRAGT